MSSSAAVLTTASHDNHNNNNHNNNNHNNNSSSSTSCLICYDTLEFRTLTACAHNDVCPKCSLRLRVLHNDAKCPICKQTNEQLIVVDDNDKSFEDYSIWGNSLGADFVYKDSPINTFYPPAYYQSTIQPLLAYACQVPGCRYDATSGRDVQEAAAIAAAAQQQNTDNNTTTTTTTPLRRLQDHLRSKHRTALCNLCVDHQRDFVSQLPRFSPKQLQTHLKVGDGPNSAFAGHPVCEFCRPTRFYDLTQLHNHLNQAHEKCHVCTKLGLPNQFFRNYQSLEKHFDQQHYLCRDVQCLQARFVVFENPLDLQLHERQVHGATSTGKIQLEFRYSSRTPTSSSVPSDQEFNYSLDGTAFVPAAPPTTTTDNNNDEQGSLHWQRTQELRQRAAQVRREHGLESATTSSQQQQAAASESFPTLPPAAAAAAAADSRNAPMRVGWASGATIQRVAKNRAPVGQITEEAFPSLGPSSNNNNNNNNHRGGGKKQLKGHNNNNNNNNNNTNKAGPYAAAQQFAAMQLAANNNNNNNNHNHNSAALWGGPSSSTSTTTTTTIRAPVVAQRRQAPPNLASDFPSLGGSSALQQQQQAAATPRRSGYAAAEAYVQEQRRLQQQSSSTTTTTTTTLAAATPQWNNPSHFPSVTTTTSSSTTKASVRDRLLGPAAPSAAAQNNVLQVSTQSRSAQATVEEIKAVLGKAKYKELKQLTMQLASNNLDGPAYIDRAAVLFDQGYHDRDFWQFVPTLVESCPNPNASREALAYLQDLKRLQNGARNAAQATNTTTTTTTTASSSSWNNTARKPAAAAVTAAAPAPPPRTAAAAANSWPAMNAPSSSTRTPSRGGAWPAPSTASRLGSTNSTTSFRQKPGAWGGAGGPATTVLRAKAPPGSVAVAAAAAAAGPPTGSATKFMAQHVKQQKQQNQQQKQQKQQQNQQQKQQKQGGSGSSNKSSKKNKNKQKNQLKQLAFGT